MILTHTASEYCTEALHACLKEMHALWHPDGIAPNANAGHFVSIGVTKMVRETMAMNAYECLAAGNKLSKECFLLEQFLKHSCRQTIVAMQEVLLDIHLKRSGFMSTREHVLEQSRC